MKKYFVLAAIAMIAFAGCKKEESGMVALKVGVENTDGMDKQTYNTQLNRIMFNGEDMWVNGTTYGISPLNGDDDPYTTTENSYRAGLNVPVSVLYGQSFIAGYPDGAFNGFYDATSGIWELADGMLDDAYMICDVNAIDEQGNVEMDPYQYRAWPMVAYDECGSCVAESGRFIMKNTVAILSPSFLYGINWFAAMNATYSMGYDMTRISNANALPDVTVTKVELVSSSELLSGPAYVANVTTAEPKLVMDGACRENMITLNDCGTYTHADNNNFTNPNIIGQIPVAVFQHETDLVMNVYFTIGDYNFVYHGPAVHFTPDMTVRSKRTVLQINMRDAENMSRFQML